MKDTQHIHKICRVFLARKDHTQHMVIEDEKDHFESVLVVALHLAFHKQNEFGN